MPLVTVTRSKPTGPAFTRVPTLGSVVTGLPELALGAAFFVVWVDPTRFGGGMVRFAMELMLLEFILIHSAPFMGLAAVATESRKKQVMGFVGLGAFYSLFVLGFCLSMDTWRPMITFWIVTAQRLGASLYDPRPSDETKAWVMNGIAINAMLYLGFVGLTLLAPLPRLGITTEVRDALGITVGGAWPESPHRVVVLAGLYYLFRGWFTVRAIPRRTLGAAKMTPD